MKNNFLSIAMAAILAIMGGVMIFDLVSGAGILDGIMRSLIIGVAGGIAIIAIALVDELMLGARQMTQVYMSRLWGKEKRELDNGATITEIVQGTKATRAMKFETKDIQLAGYAMIAIGLVVGLILLGSLILLGDMLSGETQQVVKQGLVVR